MSSNVPPKAYGIHLAQKPFKAPFTESLPPPLEVYATTWYPQFGELLDRARQGYEWQWADVRPDAIIGFAPSGSTFNLTAHWALYLSLFAKINGQSAEVPFPGSMNAYKSKFNEASSKMIAKLAIWASLNPDKAASEAFNIADQAKAQTMEERWPKLAAYFGLKGVGPSEGEDVLLPGQYVKKHAKVLEALGIPRSQVWKGEFLDTYGFYLDFDRHFSLEKARGRGFVEETDPNQSWFEAFKMFRDAGFVPSFNDLKTSD